MNWDSYKFHCSSLKYLMTNPRRKSESLSKTTKRHLQEVYIREKWGREKPDLRANKYIQKGIRCETDSLELVEDVTGNKYFKNQKTFNNDYIVGTPDVVNPDLIDIKTSWDIFSFMSVDKKKGKKDYYYQLLGYMWLTEKETSFLAYCLVDTPQDMRDDELSRLAYRIPEDEVEEYKKNFEYGDIDEEKRLKVYKFSLDESQIEKAKERVKLSRDYLKKIEKEMQENNVNEML